MIYQHAHAHTHTHHFVRNCAVDMEMLCSRSISNLDVMPGRDKEKGALESDE